MASVGLYARRRKECYFVRGSRKGNKPVSEVIPANNKAEARKKFEKKHPNADVFQVYERDC